MTKQIKETSTNFIELDKVKIDEQLSKSGKFSSDGISIKKWTLIKGAQEPSESKDENKYLCKLEKNEFKYAGTLNNKFQRDGYGYETYSNGDQYFGKFNSDLRSDKGIYFYAPEKKEGNQKYKNVLRECYFGEWVNNAIGKNGIYMWLDEPDDNIEYDFVNFEAFLGEFEEGKYLRGTYLTKSNDDYSLYHGNFNKDGQKCDNNAYFYSSKWNKILHGKIVNNTIESGYFGALNEEEDGVKEIIYCIFNKDGSVNEIIEQNNLNEEEIEDERKNLNNFKNIIFQDIFGKLYIKYNRIKRNMSKLDNIDKILEDEENIVEIDKILNKYSKKNIYFDIEKKFFGKEL
jgi:hypothetical protein